MQTYPDEVIYKLVDSVSHRDRVKIKIDSSIGRRQYSNRLGAIESVFDNITVNKGMNRFTIRGQDKVNTQWQMYCFVHNIEKLKKTYIRAYKPNITQKASLKTTLTG